MVDHIDPNKLEDSAADSLRKDLGEQAQLEGHLTELGEKLSQLPEQAPALERGELLLEIARTHQVLDRGEQAWPLARTAFELFSGEQAWEHAADACDVLYQSNQPDSLVALANGIWLYGGSAEQIAHTLRAGRNGAMPAFQDTLSEDKIHILTAYVYGLNQ